MPVSIKAKKFLIYSLNVAFAVIEGFLLFRMLLKILAANPSPFVTWIYNVSGSLLGPFEGMFAPFVSQSGHIFEFTTFFTIGFYGVIYYFVYQLIMFFADVIVKNQKPAQPQQGQNQPTPSQ